MREKEREKEKKLKKLENEENADETNGQDDDKSEVCNCKIMFNR